MAASGIVSYPQRGEVQVVVSGLATDGWTENIDVSAWPDRTVNIFGTASSAHVKMYGANHTATGAFVLLTNEQGDDISTAGLNVGFPAMEQILQSCKYVKFLVSGSAGAANINIVIVGRRQHGS